MFYETLQRELIAISEYLLRLLSRLSHVHSVSSPHKFGAILQSPLPVSSLYSLVS